MLVTPIRAISLNPKNNSKTGIKQKEFQGINYSNMPMQDQVSFGNLKILEALKAKRAIFKQIHSTMIDVFKGLDDAKKYEVKEEEIEAFNDRTKIVANRIGTEIFPLMSKVKFPSNFNSVGKIKETKIECYQNNEKIVYWQLQKHRVLKAITIDLKDNSIDIEVNPNPNSKLFKRKLYHLDGAFKNI